MPTVSFPIRAEIDLYEYRKMSGRKGAQYAPIKMLSVGKFCRLETQASWLCYLKSTSDRQIELPPYSMYLQKRVVSSRCSAGTRKDDSLFPDIPKSKNNDNMQLTNGISFRNCPNICKVRLDEHWNIAEFTFSLSEYTEQLDKLSS